MSFEERVKLLKKKETDQSDKIGVICILDKSGSMESLRDETIQMFNDFLVKQKTIEDNAEFSVLLFDTQVIKHAWKQRISSVRPLDRETYCPDGFTALYDALGIVLSELNYQKAIVVIITDGQENSSKYWKKAAIKSKIKAKEESGWKFEYFGVGVEEFAEEAALIGIAHCYYNPGSPEGINLTGYAVADTISLFIDEESRTS